MSRLQRIAGVAFVVASAIVVSAFTAPTPTPTQPISATVGMIAKQLGIKVQNRPDDEFVPGVQFTGTLENPEKLALVGIKDMHKGARVTVACMSFEKVIVDADEFSPDLHSAKVTLRLDDTGRLAVPPKT